MTSVKRKIWLHEDWAVVVIGFAIIAAFLTGLSIPVPSYTWSGAGQLAELFSSDNLVRMAAQFVFMFMIATAGALLTGRRIKSFILVFPIICLLTVVALFLAGNKELKGLNLEAVIFSLALGLLVSNTIALPAWFREALSAELFVKIGLVLLGTSIIFSDILKAGSLGLIQALVVVFSVWYFAFWLCKKFRIDDELALMISSAVSICGVSAAIATAGAIKGDPKKLSYVISLVLITAIPMMIFMPYMAAWLGLSQEVTGAWLGGSIDTTGAVVASGTLVGETALKISTIVKFSQNVLLGIAAFAISVYWTYRKPSDNAVADKPTVRVLWERFPKFVIGFIAASVLFSFFLSPGQVNEVKDGLKSIQTLWFVLAFTSIGLETKFRDIVNTGNQKPLYAFLIAQTFNIVVTLILAYLLFR